MSILVEFFFKYTKIGGSTPPTNFIQSSMGNIDLVEYLICKARVVWYKNMVRSKHKLKMVPTLQEFKNNKNQTQKSIHGKYVKKVLYTFVKKPRELKISMFRLSSYSFK